MIPQSSERRQPHNVIRGEFQQPGQLDWAVLCSRARVSTILVFWKGNPAEVDSVATTPDRDYLQGMGAEGIVFSRGISPADSGVLYRQMQRYGGPEPSRPLHHGINDSFDGKASIVRYWHRGQWLTLAGVD